ncbi:MAG: toll/interleukin-1 receptor domain-containing protein, partial [Candidatus Micrarchaeota archaeon]
MKAFEFTEKRIEEEYSKKKMTIDKAHHGALDFDKTIELGRIRLYRKFINDVGDSVYEVGLKEYADLNSTVRSALELYFLSLQDAFRQTTSASIQSEMTRVAAVLALDGVRRAKGDLFLKYSSVKVSTESQVVSVFICYKDSPDKELAGKLKELFEKAGTPAFVAHDDIRLGENWPDEVRKQLSYASVVVPIVSSDFTESACANQEVGFAEGK